MDQTPKKVKVFKMQVMTLGLILALVACEKPQPEPYVSKREGKVVETAFNTMTEAMTEIQGEKLEPGTEIEMEQVKLDREETQEPVQTEEEVMTEGPQEATVNAETLNVRSMPSQNSEIITKLPQGTQVILLSTEDNAGATWAHIRIDGVTGYVVLTYLDQ